MTQKSALSGGNAHEKTMIVKFLGTEEMCSLQESS